MQMTTRGLVILFLVTALGCGGGAEPKPADPDTSPTPEQNPKNSTSAVDPPPSDVVESWGAAGGTVGRLRLQTWGDRDFEARLPQRPDDLLAFYFDDLEPGALDKVLVPEIPFAVVIYRAHDRQLDTLNRLNSMQVLQLVGSVGLTDAGLAQVAKATGLREVTVTRDEMTNPEKPAPNITDKGLKSLTDLKQLERLHIHGYRNLNNSVFTALSGLSKLHALSLVKSAVGPGLQGIGTFGELRELDLSSTGVSDLKAIEGLTKLRILRLADSKGISDTALASLVKLRNLEKLDLTGTNIGDAGLAKLTPLTSLRLLGLQGCEKVTPAARGELRKQNTSLLIK